MGDRASKADGGVVRLNVGGKAMLVAQSTLAKDGRSVLGRMFAADSTLPPAALLDDGSYFLDYDPHCFAVVIDHLRHGTVDIDPALVGRVRCTADSLGVASLVAACDAQLAAARTSRSRDGVKQRTAECCPKCGEILFSDDEKERMRSTMRCLLDQERVAFTGFWYRLQYERYRAMVYHECRSPLRLLRNHWFELTVLVLVGTYVVKSARSTRWFNGK